MVSILKFYPRTFSELHQNVRRATISNLGGGLVCFILVSLVLPGVQIPVHALPIEANWVRSQ